MPTSPPRICPRCGAEDSYRRRFTTGGGWRVTGFVCDDCGRRIGV